MPESCLCPLLKAGTNGVIKLPCLCTERKLTPFSRFNKVPFKSSCLWFVDQYLRYVVKLSDWTCWWSYYGNPFIKHEHVTAYMDTSHPDRKHRPEIMKHNCKCCCWLLIKNRCMVLQRKMDNLRWWPVVEWHYTMSYMGYWWATAFLMQLIISGYLFSPEDSW